MHIWQYIEHICKIFFNIPHTASWKCKYFVNCSIDFSAIRSILKNNLRFPECNEVAVIFTAIGVVSRRENFQPPSPANDFAGDEGCFWFWKWGKFCKGSVFHYERSYYDGNCHCHTGRRISAVWQVACQDLGSRSERKDSCIWTGRWRGLCPCWPRRCLWTSVCFYRWCRSN